MTQWGLDTLFNPAKRHMDEEKRRLQSTREEIGDNSGGKRIDLESGKVRIRKAESDPESESDAELDTDSDTASEVDSESGAGTEAGAGSAVGSAADTRTGVGSDAADAAAVTTAGPGSGARSHRADSGTGPSAAAIRAARRRGREPR